MKLLTYLKSIALFLILLIISLPFTFAGEQNLVYDGVGNLISGDGFIREYNGFNQLVRIRNESGGILEDFVWHPTEERIFIKKIYNSSGEVATRITYLNENSVKIKNSSGTFYETYVYEDGVLVGQMNTDGQKQATHNDHLGSVSLITDSAGNVAENSFFSPFGEIIEGGKVSRYDFTGKEFDSKTQDYDFNARRYNPAITRFLQPDNNIPATYDPQSLNRYSYGLNNPYKFIDPNGREPVRSQAGNAGQVIKYIKDIEKNNPNLSPNQVLEKVYNEYLHYEKSSISDKSKESYSPNFVYTENQGVVDIRHFVGNAYYVQKTGSETFTHTIFNAWEITQLVRAPWSFFTYEDLVSNRLGREFGMNFDPEMDLSEQFEEFFKNNRAGKFPRWLWDTMPDKEGWLFVSWNKMKFKEEGKALPRSSHVSVGGGIELKPHCFVKEDPHGCRY